MEITIGPVITGSLVMVLPIRQVAPVKSGVGAGRKLKDDGAEKQNSKRRPQNGRGRKLRRQQKPTPGIKHSFMLKPKQERKLKQRPKRMHEPLH